MALAPLSPHAMTVRRYDRDRFVTVLLASPERREDLFTLYAFNLEIARVRETVRETMLGQIRLQWWRDNLETLWRGGQIGHPVGDDLADLVTRHDLKRPSFDRLIDARDVDLQDGPPRDDDELRRYIDDSAGELSSLAALLLGGGDQATQLAARAVGQAWGRIGLMRAHAFHIKTRRLYLPGGFLANHHLDSEALFAGAAPPALARLAEEWAEIAESDLRRARALRRDIAKPALPALLLATLADGYLAGLRRTGYNLLDRGWSSVNSRPLRLLLAKSAGRF